MNFSRTQRAAAAAWLCLALTACGGGGSGDNDPAALPAALSVALPASVAPGAALALATNATEAVGLSYAWDFGDGGTSAEAAPSHTWAAPGRYTVTVTVTNNAGEARNFSATVTVGQLANVAGLVCSEANDAGWCWQRPLPTGNQVQAIAVSGTTAWAAGEVGTLLKSVDAGATWTPLHGPAMSTLSGVSFADEQNGWALSLDGSVWRTTDGGVRWSAVPLPDDLSREALYAPEILVFSRLRVLVRGGYGVGILTQDGGLSWTRLEGRIDAMTPSGSAFRLGARYPDPMAVERSADGGTSWTTVFTPPLSRYGYEGAISFTDDLNGWFFTTDYDASYNLQPRIWRTTDGGNRWDELTVSGLQLNAFSPSLRMFGAAGWAWNGYAGSVHRTVDGGSTWVAVTLPPTLNYSTSIHPLDGSTLWASGDGGVALTTDGGEHWTWLQARQEANSMFASPTFERAGSAYLLRYGSRVYRSTDQGATWSRVLGGTASEEGSDLRSIAFTDASNGWAAGDEGSLLRTTDGGRHWTPVDFTLDGFGSAGALQFVDAANGWLLTGNHVLARTVDGGAHWSAPGGAAQPAAVRSFQFIDLQRGWALGELSATDSRTAVWRTSDGGASWQAAALPGTFGAIAFADATTGVAVSGSGRAARSVDGGQTWTTVATGTNRYLSKVRFTSSTGAIAIGESGLVLRSDDAGATWRVLTPQTPHDLNDVHFADSKTGWIVGNGGTVLSTHDGGLSWSVQASGTTRDLHSIFATDGSTAWIGGADGLVLATAFGGGR